MSMNSPSTLMFSCLLSTKKTQSDVIRKSTFIAYVRPKYKTHWNAEKSFCNSDPAKAKYFLNGNVSNSEKNNEVRKNKKKEKDDDNDELRLLQGFDIYHRHELNINVVTHKRLNHTHTRARKHTYTHSHPHIRNLFFYKSAICFYIIRERERAETQSCWQKKNQAVTGLRLLAHGQQTSLQTKTQVRATAVRVCGKWNLSRVLMRLKDADSRTVHSVLPPMHRETGICRLVTELSERSCGAWQESVNYETGSQFILLWTGM